ncbi:MAG: ABC transporter ATP-binding protein [Lachnospiraceae bacterium]
MLEVKNISFSYIEEKEPIIENVSFTLKPGERLGIVAPSGAGKTTLLKILSGYEKPDAGEVLIDGEPLSERGYCPVQMIWQHPEHAVNPRRKMREVLKEGNGIEERMIERLGIEEDWKNRYPQELSGGELQRFCIARALGKGTKYLLADEISTMLDLITQGQIWNFLMEETARRQIGMIVVSHSQPLLDYVCTRQIRLKK